MVSVGMIPSFVSWKNMSQNLKMYHIVCISFRPGVSEEQKESIYNDYQELGETCGGAAAGIRHWSVSKNMDTRKGIELVEVAVLDDEAALDRLKKHDAHQQVVDALRVVADWTVADAWLPFPLPATSS